MLTKTFESLLTLVHNVNFIAGQCDECRSQSMSVRSPNGIGCNETVSQSTIVYSPHKNLLSGSVHQ